MRLLLAGHGEVGKGIDSIFNHHHEVVIIDPKNGSWMPDETLAYDGLLVCFPYSDDFEKQVNGYINRYAPEVVIIFSTVPIGTTKLIAEPFPYKEIAHFPVEGKHPNLGEDIYLYDNVLGPVSGMSVKKIAALFESVEVEFELLENSNQTEFLKLRSLAYYAINIEFARASGAWAKYVGISNQVIKEYDIKYNFFNLGRDRPQFVRYVLDPPSGPIGGHCVLAGVKHLMRLFPHDDLLGLIIDVNEAEATDWRPE